MAQQTAIDWIVDQMLSEGHKEMWKDMIQQAKQMEKQNKIDFLVWLKENHWHVYKDGTWFTSKDHAYMNGKPRKFYTEEQLIEKYKEYGKENNND
jgi:tRNA G10  N-methylase Trm11